MNKYLKIALGILGVILLGIGILVVAFILEMKPDKDKEEEVRIQAEQYLEDNFNDNFEIYDTLYDNMGNFEFEYAAKVKDKKTNTEFLVYYDDETKQMVDTYIADKWADDLESEIRPFIKENFGETTDFFVFFTDDNIGQELGIDPLNSKSYKEFDVAPIIRITVTRKKSEDDEKILNEFIAFLKSEDKLQHGSFTMSYIDEKGVILDDEWIKDF
ncbi:hypothetical protein [Lysinibacillus pakistanensis]|uniref:Uncharacterized protein n=1 Tax=Lysinibacillus pakistanensis TaxID=759811 RepID=A0AAX3WYJ2_9BACI|nr:hypothetical protein [Lysinibacillus pakistanensis]MDM5230893.1 hypothetical protein [Lysinibacillus pakistanensis]WHY46459.1 hypothetical protein QNH22_25010 [Lysinibacillus pakistanensis]WHY51472.1 hypothetical protein QNH24_24970 [Lysinibacillus pakistanensis]